MFNAAIERGTGVRRVHITEEAQMKEQAAGENAVDVQDG